MLSELLQRMEERLQYMFSWHSLLQKHDIIGPAPAFLIEVSSSKSVGGPLNLIGGRERRMWRVCQRRERVQDSINVIEEEQNEKQVVTSAWLASWDLMSFIGSSLLNQY